VRSGDAPAPPSTSPPPSFPSPPSPPLASPPLDFVTTLDLEIALLRDARHALRGGQPAEALALLDEHARRFPSGALAEDRAAERVFALCALGDVAQARAEGVRFLATHARSPYADAVRGSCGSPRPAK
jgi:hypothetical protein